MRKHASEEELAEAIADALAKKLKYRSDMRDLGRGLLMMAWVTCLYIVMVRTILEPDVYMPTKLVASVIGLGGFLFVGLLWLVFDCTRGGHRIKRLAATCVLFVAFAANGYVATYHEKFGLLMALGMFVGPFFIVLFGVNVLAYKLRPNNSA